MRLAPPSALALASILSLASGALAQPILLLPDNREGWPFGTCIHKLAQQSGPATQALDDLGAPWVRIDINWHEVETAKGVFDWTEVDKMITIARARGYLVFATLAYTPTWATTGKVRSGVPTAASHYGDFVAAVVKRHKDKVKHWGLWNEPEQGHFWEGTAKQLVGLVLKPGFDAIRAADPTALVLGPDSGSHDWLVEIFKEGGGTYLDVITIHVYACCDSSDNPQKVLWRLDCTGGWPWDPCLRNAIVQAGQGQKPLWLTEVGWKTLTPDWEAKQATYYAELLDAMLARSWWKKTIFYELYDQTACNPSTDNCWGIVRMDWTRKLAFDGLKSYILKHQPRAEAGSTLTGSAGAPIAFDGSASSDPDGTLATFRWDFDRSDG